MSVKFTTKSFIFSGIHGQLLAIQQPSVLLFRWYMVDMKIYSRMDTPRLEIHISGYGAVNFPPIIKACFPLVPTGNTSRSFHNYGVYIGLSANLHINSYFGVMNITLARESPKQIAPICCKSRRKLRDNFLTARFCHYLKRKISIGYIAST